MECRLRHLNASNTSLRNQTDGSFPSQIASQSLGKGIPLGLVALNDATMVLTCAHGSFAEAGNPSRANTPLQTSINNNNIKTKPRSSSNDHQAYDRAQPSFVVL
jgi:hypothetical protein